MFVLRSVIFVTCVLAIREVQAMDLLSFAENTGGVTPWETHCENCDYDLTIEFASTMPGDNLKWNRQGVEFTDPEFANLFGSEASLLSLNRPDPTGAGGETTAMIQFATPLPQGAKLVVFDVDAIDERITLFSNIHIDAPVIMETRMDPSDPKFDYPSVPARWDPETQTLASAGPDAVNNNPFEAYLFDATGMARLEARYTTTAGQASISFALPVPEPTPWLPLTVMALAALAVGRRTQ